MTCNEMREEFNLFYNNLSSNQAPGLLDYEISVYLTRAEHMFVDSVYAEYEKSEEARKKLSEIVIPKKLYTTSSGIVNICPDSVCFKLPEDVKYIVFETILMNKNAKKCMRGHSLEVQPVSHDEFYRIYGNPFRFNDRRALRLDISYNGDKYSEIVCTDKNNIDYYLLRYIKQPRPIFLSGCSTNDVIDGIAFDSNSDWTCELNPIVHRDIVQIAAKLAYADYKN